jgi:catechol 2,3-dioxygenase-like lactoylglutathione lyase family enzyme
LFSHVVLGSNDLERSKTFYDAILGVLGVKPAPITGDRMFYVHADGNLGVTKPIDGKPATFANGGTIGFKVSGPAQADAWHAAGVANGGVSCEDPPGVRDLGAFKLYLAYLRDPDGNKLCAMCPAG